MSEAEQIRSFWIGWLRAAFGSDVNVPEPNPPQPSPCPEPEECQQRVKPVQEEDYSWLQG